VVVGLETRAPSRPELGRAEGDRQLRVERVRQTDLAGARDAAAAAPSTSKPFGSWNTAVGTLTTGMASKSASTSIANTAPAAIWVGVKNENDW